MDSPTVAPNPPFESSRIPRWGWAVLALGLLLYSVLLGTHVGAYAGGSDSSGYINNARLLSERRVQIERRAIPGLPAEKARPYTYVPLGFLPVNDHEMVPTYPVGLSMLIVGVSQIVGWDAAPNVTMLLHGVFGVVLLFALAREAGLSFSLALFGALLLALSPLYLFMSVQAMSDTPSLTWCAASVWFAWQSRRNPRWAIAAGAATAIAVLVRPSDLLIMLPVSICLGLDWRRWLWLGIGAAPGALFLGLVNYALYGNPLASGYGAVSGIFSWEYAPPALANYAKWLPVVLTPGVLLVFWLPSLLRRESLRLLAVLTTWLLVFAVFYVFYFHTHEAWWYLRFLLPAFPAFILAMLLVARSFASRWKPKSHLVAAAVIVVALGGWDFFWGKKLSALESGKGERVYPDSAKWARSHLPKNAVVMTMQTSGALLYYTDFVFVRWDQFDPSNIAQLEQVCREKGFPLCAMFFPFEVEEVIERKRFPGSWKKMGALRDVTFWEYVPASMSTAATR
jgi:hypothetical protein